MEEISATRFNAIAGYARGPRARLIGEEIGYYQATGGKLLGLLVRDRTDGDYAGMVMGPDKKLRYRSTSMTKFFEEPRQAVAALDKLMNELANAPEEVHHQGDEDGPPVNFFSPLHAPEDLHPAFQVLATKAMFSPARAIVEPMMRWHEDLDGNFVEQFQSTGFDQRMWELYLFAMLTELGYLLDRSHAVPDFIGQSLAGKVAIEAMTVAPTRNGNDIVPPPPTDTAEQIETYLQDYMPIKFGSPLFSKLQMKYWEQPQIAGLPLVFAIADFSSPGSMVLSRPALERYLYGFSQEAARDEQGNVIGQPKRIIEHRWQGKVVPSGFFEIPDAKHVSAVISTTAGTISKFNRMGMLAGFHKDAALLLRTGTCFVHDPTATLPAEFKSVVNADDYRETWVEGLNVYHNPHATVTLPESCLAGAAHHHCDGDGRWVARVPSFHPLESHTEMLAGVDVSKFLKTLQGPATRFWTQKSADTHDAHSQ